MSVAPTATRLGQIGLPLGGVRFGDGTDKQLGTKHILILLSQCLRVVGKVEDQRAHQRIALFADAAGTLLDIGAQCLTLLDAVGYHGLCLLAVVPRLGIAHIAMDTHQWQIDRQLYPAQHAVDVCLVLILVLWTEEATGIVGPPREACRLYT